MVRPLSRYIAIFIMVVPETSLRNRPGSELPCSSQFTSSPQHWASTHSMPPLAQTLQDSCASGNLEIGTSREHGLDELGHLFSRLCNTALRRGRECGWSVFVSMNNDLTRTIVPSSNSGSTRSKRNAVDNSAFPRDLLPTTTTTFSSLPYDSILADMHGNTFRGSRFP